MSKKSGTIQQHDADAPVNPLRTRNEAKYQAVQARCMESFTRQLDAVRESVQTARFRWSGEWWNYWFYELWRIDPAGRGTAGGFASMQAALDHYDMKKQTFYDYRNEATSILRAVHGDELPEGVTFTGEVAKWAYRASKEARLIEHSGDLKLLEAPPSSKTGEAPELPEDIRKSLRSYYMDKRQAKEQAKADKAKSKRAVPKLKRGSASQGLKLLNEGLQGMLLVWKNRDALTPSQKKEYDYILRMFDLYAAADAYDPKDKSDRSTEDFTYAQAIKISEAVGVEALREKNRFAYAALFPTNNEQ